MNSTKDKVTTLMRSSTDNINVIDNIPINIQAGEVLKRLQLRRKNKLVEEIVRDLIEIVASVARPKAVFKCSRINIKDGDKLEIDGVEFVSHSLRVLDRTQPVFPYVTTYGREIDTIKISSSAAMQAHCLNVIKSMVVTSASIYLQDHLVKHYAPGQISRVSPGHPESWPVTQQKEMFSVLGKVEDLIGVRLTDSFLMMPVESICGIFYPTETWIERCLVCLSETCRDRKTPYAPSLLE